MVKYDDRTVLETTKFYTALNCKVLLKLKSLEKDAIHNASTKKGCTTHSNRL
jgi:hypothetical protein